MNVMQFKLVIIMTNFKFHFILAILFYFFHFTNFLQVKKSYSSNNES